MSNASVEIIEVTIVKEANALELNKSSIEVTSNNKNINEYFTMKAWENVIAATSCESYSYLINTLSADGVPVLVKLTPNNTVASEVFYRLRAELFTMLDEAYKNGLEFITQADVSLTPSSIINTARYAKSFNDFVTLDVALASLLIGTAVPGAFFIQTVLNEAYLHVPQGHGVHDSNSNGFETILDCCSARNIDNGRVAKVLLTLESVVSVGYVPEANLNYLAEHHELLLNVGQTYQLADLYSTNYDRVRQLVMGKAHYSDPLPFSINAQTSDDHPSIAAMPMVTLYNKTTGILTMSVRADQVDYMLQMFPQLTDKHPSTFILGYSTKW